jgi:predicted O-methyltransferase YrrM
MARGHIERLFRRAAGAVRGVGKIQPGDAGAGRAASGPPKKPPASAAGASRPVASASSEGLSKSPAKLAEQPAGGYLPPDPIATFPPAPMTRHALLGALHRSLRPRTYLETGVQTGLSMALSRTRSIGIDPAFTITHEIRCNVHLVRATSDDFFARADPLAHFRGVPIDLAFVDGMHLSEFALRDFMNVEKFMAPTGAVVFDDMLPRNALEAARDRQTKAWTGDVFKVLAILVEQRPDLAVIPLNTRPTGTVIVLGLSPSSEVLRQRYPENLRRCLTPDPQPVPDAILHRTIAADPQEVTRSPVWSVLRELRAAGADRDAVGAAVREHLGRFILPDAGLLG